MILLFRKKDKKVPENYRDINLLSAVLKWITKIITNKIDSTTTMADELQRFSFGIFCNDMVLFVFRKITEKLLEHNKRALLLFHTLELSFRHIQLGDVIHLLYSDRPHKDYSEHKYMYAGNIIQAKIVKVY